MYNPANLSLERYFQEPADYNKDTYQGKTVCLDGIIACSFSYYDGAKWQERWGEGAGKLPKAIKIIFKFRDEEVSREFTANIPISP